MITYWDENILALTIYIHLLKQKSTLGQCTHIVYCWQCFIVCVPKKKRERYREIKKQMGLLEAWISRHGERILMCRISIAYVSNLSDGVCLTGEWLINLSSAHLTSSLHILTRQVLIQPWWRQFGVWHLSRQYHINPHPHRNMKHHVLHEVQGLKSSYYCFLSSVCCM